MKIKAGIVDASKYIGIIIDTSKKDNLQVIEKFKRVKSSF